MQLEDGLRRLLSAAAPLPVERVSTWDAPGRIASSAVLAPGAVPHFARAAMDGYVCHAADLRGATSGHPVVLRLTGAVGMGEPPGAGPERGEAWTITTGGAIPSRGDSVLPLEAGRLADQRLSIERPPDRKSHIAAPGEDIQAGARLVTAGETVSAASAGALAACGIHEVTVYRRPRLALVATGTELVELGELGEEQPLPSGRVINSNSVMLAGELRAAGFTVDYEGIIADRPEDLRKAFAALTDGYDVVISTGGVSVGRYDAVHRTWLDLGVERIVGHVDLKPGGPFFAGRLGETWTIGLSGTPVACLAAFHLMVLPLLRRLEGRRHCVRPQSVGTLASEFPRSTERLRALWAHVEERSGDFPDIHLLVRQPEGNVASLLSANALVLVPPGTPPLPSGSRVTALLLDRQEDRDSLEVRPPVLRPPVVGVVGESGSGKTTVIAGLLRRLSSDGIRALAVKHAAHGYMLDAPGSDSARMVEAGAAIVVLAGPAETAVRISSGVDDADGAARLAQAVAARLWRDRPDLILVEGFDHPGNPVIQVGRQKTDAAAGEVWSRLPEVTGLSAEQSDLELDRLAAVVRARLGRVEHR